jgi:hypothetical protein
MLLQTDESACRTKTEDGLRILDCMRGHPARWNDKTVVLFDAFVRGVHEGTVPDDNEFTLFELDGNGDVVGVQRQWAWLLVDNVCSSWPTTVPPFKRTIQHKEIRFSQWLESMQKDVECAFGIT